MERSLQGTPVGGAGLRPAGQGSGGRVLWVVGWSVVRIQSPRQHGDHPEKASLCLLLRKQLVEKWLFAGAGLSFRQLAEKQTRGQLVHSGCSQHPSAERARGPGLSHQPPTRAFLSLTSKMRVCACVCACVGVCTWVRVHTYVGVCPEVCV